MAKSMAKKRISREYRTALHEAGHAVMTWLKDKRLGLTSIDVADFKDKENCRGISNHYIPKSFFEDMEIGAGAGNGDALLHKMETQLEMLLAGVVAESLWAGRHNWAGAGVDMEACNDLWWRWWGDNGDLWGAHRRYLLLKVRHELSSARNRQLIRVVADALVKLRRLTGKQVHQIICDELDRQCRQIGAAQARNAAKRQKQPGG